MSFNEFPNTSVEQTKEVKNGSGEELSKGAAGGCDKHERITKTTALNLSNQMWQ